MSDRARIALYALTVFLSSALLLVLEVVAGRLIAPYVGVSLYTWTAVIGVILAGLSLGNWLGGVWADRGAGETAAGHTLLVSALATLAIPLLTTLVAPGIQQSELSLLSASLLLVLSLFLLPALLLGVVTPLLTTLALRLSQRTGHIVGMMHALAAVGSICGTFLTGYWLIQRFGSRSVILVAAVTLALLALPLVRRGRRLVYPALLVAAGVLVATTYARDGLATPCDRESTYFCIRVVEEPWHRPPGVLRSMVLDHLLHGSNHQQDPTLLVAPYVQLIDEMSLSHFGKEPPQRFFFIGGGAYTLPRAVRASYPEAHVSVAELDPAVTEMAEQRLFVDTGDMRIEHADARLVLAREPGESYDLIVGDAFHDIAIPPHLVTREMAALVRQRLSPDGLYLLNVVDAFPDARLVKAMVKTLREEFPEVSVWLDEVPSMATRVTYVIAAAHRRAPSDVLYARRGLKRRWFNVTQPVLATGTPLEELPLLTDDHVPVERLMASLFVTPLGR